MPREWAPTTLGECADFFSGGTPRKSNDAYWTGQIPWISGKDLKLFYVSDSEDHITAEAAEQGSRLVPPGTILLLVRGMTLHNNVPVAIVKRESAFNQDIKAIRARTHVNQEFLAFWLVAQKPQLLATVHAAGHGTGVLATDRLKDMAINLPSMDEQKRIASVFKLIEDKIEQNHRTGRKLEELTRAVFKAWFVDFEPVKAKAAGATGFPGMPAAAFTAMPDRFVESELGPLPEGWRVHPLQAVAEAEKGLSYKGAGLVNGPHHPGAVPLHNLNSVFEGGGYKPHGVKYYKGEFKPRHVVRPGDLIITNTEQGFEYRLIGFPAIVPKRYGKMGLFTHHIFRLVPLEDSNVGRHFLYHCLLGGRIRDEVCGCSNGTTVNMLAIDGLKRPRICVPTKTVADAFENLAATSHDLNESLEDESRSLAALRDYLLPRMLSGRVRVQVQNNSVASALEAPSVARSREITSKRVATDEFKEAVLISALVHALAEPNYPLGRKRYNKFAYFIHRKAEHDVRLKYVKQAAGPYSPWARYEGPERIAVEKGYVKRARSGKYAGLVPGEKIGAIDTYLPRYGVQEAFDWAIKQFRYTNNDELELLATVDFAAVTLRTDREAVTTKSVRELIASEPKWAPKLERTIFSEMNVERALHDLWLLLPGEYEGSR